METIAAIEQYKIEVDLGSGIIAMRFFGNISDELYKEMWQKSLDTVLEHKIKNYLIDQREIGNVSFTARAWVLVKILPQVRKHVGLPLYGAILPSANLLHSTGMDFLTKGFTKISQIYTRKFSDEATALDWLRSDHEVKSAAH